MRQESQDQTKLNPQDYYNSPYFDRILFTSRKSRQTRNQGPHPFVRVHSVEKSPSNYYQEKSTTCSTYKHQFSTKMQTERKSFDQMQEIIQIQSIKSGYRKSRWQKLNCLEKKKFSLEPYIFSNDLSKLLELPKQNIGRSIFTERKRSGQEPKLNSQFVLKETILDKRTQGKKVKVDLKSQLKLHMRNGDNSLIPQMAAQIIKTYRNQIRSNKRLFQRLEEISTPVARKLSKEDYGAVNQEINYEIYKEELKPLDKEILRQELAKIHANIYLRKRLQDRDLKNNYKKIGMISTWNQYVNDIMSEKKKVLLKLNSALNQNQRNHLLKLFRYEYDPQNHDYEDSQILQQYFDTDMYDFVCGVY